MVENAHNEIQRYGYVSFLARLAWLPLSCLAALPSALRLLCACVLLPHATLYNPATTLVLPYTHLYVLLLRVRHTKVVLLVSRDEQTTQADAFSEHGNFRMGTTKVCLCVRVSVCVCVCASA